MFEGPLIFSLVLILVYVVLVRFLPALTKSKIYPLLEFTRLPEIFHAILLIVLLSNLPATICAQATDSLLLQTDSTILADSSAQLLKQISGKNSSGSGLESEVKYNARDSMRFDVVKKLVHLYGAAEVYYESITLKADSIVMDFGKNEVFASYTTDSNKNRIGFPQFKDGSESFEADQMRYNFKTKRGLIKQATTKQSEGFITGSKIKKDSSKVIFIENGEFCPCEDKNAGTYIKAKKLKIIQDDKIITGPAYLAVEHIPTPLVLPFGFFPNTQEQTSGLLLPQYGFSPGLGFYLIDGGYFWKASPYLNMSFQGDIYTRGSWGLKSRADYKRLYKYDGNLEASYSNFLQGDREFNNDFRDQNFFVRWNHRQDPKARPNTSFSASVNAGTQNNFQNNFNSRSSDYLTNTFKSNVNYNISVPNSPFNIALNASHDQNSLDSSVTIRLPEVGLTMSRVFPFKRKERIGKEKWFEKIGLNYTGNMKNQISTKESLLFREESLQEMQNGMSHAIPISTNLKLFKYFTLNPSITYREVWQLKGLEKRWDEDRQEIINDTIPGFQRFGEASAAAGLSTILYGMYNFKGGKVKAIRHVITPSASFNFKPDFSDARFGYFKEVGIPQAALDTLNVRNTYTPFEYGLFGMPSSNESGVLNLRLQNNLEMKTMSKRDTTGKGKKVKLFDQITLAGNYDMFKDSIKWTPVSISGNATLLNKINLRYNASLDPYALNSEGRVIDQSHFSQTGNLGRLTQSTVAIGFKLSNDKQIKKLKEKQQAKTVEYGIIPWDVNISYNYNYSKPGITNARRTQTVQLRGQVQLTKKMRINASTNYDIQELKLSYTTLDIYRDLGCWELAFNIIPLGNRKSYSFSVNIKPQILKDLKIDRNREWYDLQ